MPKYTNSAIRRAPWQTLKKGINLKVYKEDISLKSAVRYIKELCRESFQGSYRSPGGVVKISFE
jgi:uncharacterized protein (DUF2132 family)